MEITPTEHEKREWRRMATAAYDQDRNDIGHQYSSFGALRREGTISLELFDAIQANYRAWLIRGFDDLPTLQHTLVNPWGTNFGTQQ